MHTIIMFLGIAVLLGIVYLLWSGQTVPPAIQKVVLIAAGLILLFCVLQAAGCDFSNLGDGIQRPTPQG